MAEPLGVKVQVGVNTTAEQFQKQIDILAKSVKADIQVNLVDANGRSTASFGKNIGDSISKNVSVGVKSAQVNIQKMQGVLDNLIKQRDLLQTSTENPKFNNSNISIPNLDKQILGAQRAINMLANGTSKGEQVFASYNQRVLEIRNSLSLVSKEISIASKGITNTNQVLSQDKGFGNLEAQMRRFLDLNPQIRNNQEYMAKYGNLLDTVTAKSGNLGVAQKEWANLQAEMERVGVTSQNLGRRLENLFKQHFNTALVMLALHQLQQALQSTIQNVEELDKSLVELSKVSDLGPSGLKAITQDAYELGSSIGRTGREVIDATTMFKRAGYDLTTSMDELAKAALVTTNIGDNIGTVEEASSALIAALRGFEIPAENVMDIVDSINEVSNNAPIDFDNITDGLERVSGVLGITGTSIDESIGLLTGGFARLRNIEKVSSGLNMIAQRLRGVSDEGEELPELIPKIQSAFDKLDYSRLGVDPIQVRDANGELKSTYDILADLQKVWGNLDSMELGFITEAIAGNRQNTVLSSIMEGWDDVSLAIENSTNATGSAIAENEKYKNSVEGTKNQIASLWQQLSNNFFSADQYKPLLSFFKELLSILTSITGNKFIMTLLTGAGIGAGIKTLGAVLKTFGQTGLGGNLKSTFSGFGRPEIQGFTFRKLPHVS